MTTPVHPSLILRDALARDDTMRRGDFRVRFEDATGRPSTRSVRIGGDLGGIWVKAQDGVISKDDEADSVRRSYAKRLAALSPRVEQAAEAIRARVGATGIVLDGRWSCDGSRELPEPPEAVDMDAFAEAARRATGRPLDFKMRVRVIFTRLRGRMRLHVSATQQGGNNPALRQPFQDLLSTALDLWVERNAAWIDTFTTVEFEWSDLPSSRHATMRGAAIANEMRLPAVPASVATRFDRFLIDLQYTLGPLRLGLRADTSGRIGLTPAKKAERVPLDRATGRIALPATTEPFIEPVPIGLQGCAPIHGPAAHLMPALRAVAGFDGAASLRIQRGLRTSTTPGTGITVTAGERAVGVRQDEKGAWFAADPAATAALAGVARALDAFRAGMAAGGMTVGAMDIALDIALDGALDGAEPPEAPAIATMPCLPAELFTFLEARTDRHCGAQVRLTRLRTGAFRVDAWVGHTGRIPANTIMTRLSRMLWERWTRENTAALRGVRYLEFHSPMAVLASPYGSDPLRLRAGAASLAMEDAALRRRVAFIPGLEPRLTPIGRAPDGGDRLGADGAVTTPDTQPA